MKISKLVPAAVLLASVLPLSTFATEPMLSDDQETPDALIREVNTGDTGETHIQFDKTLEVEQITQDPLVGTTGSLPAQERIEADSIDVVSPNADEEEPSPTLVREGVPKTSKVQAKSKAQEKNKLEKKPKKKWSSVFSRETEAQRTDQETPDPLLDDL